MNRRLILHNELIKLLGSTNVYYQPPASVLMKYPCIRYELAGESVRHADNSKYLKHKRYTLTIIDKNPDSEIPDRVDKLKLCSFDRPYSKDGLNHWVYTLYY